MGPSDLPYARLRRRARMRMPRPDLFPFAGSAMAATRATATTAAVAGLLTFFAPALPAGLAHAADALAPVGTAGAPPAARPQAAPADSVERTLPELVPPPAARALAAIGWRPEDLRFDAPDLALYGGGPGRVPIFDAWIDRPFLIPGDVALFQKSLVQAVQTPSQLAIFGGLRIGHGVRRGLLANPADAGADSLRKDDPLLDALTAVWTAAEEGGRRGSGSPARAARALAAVPRAWRLPLGVILRSEAEAFRWRTQALAGVRFPPEAGIRPALFGASESALDRWLYRQAIRYVTGLDSDAQDPAFLRGVEDTAAGVDLGFLQAGASDLLMALEKPLPADSLRLREPLRVETPLGRIVIGTAGSDRYEPGDYLLILDPAGDDLYAGGAAGTPDSPVSVLLDLSGADRYAASDSSRPAFGGAVTGLAVLIDRGGDDLYQGVNLSLGAGLCGVGVLCDRSGNDRYDAFTGSQGAGFFGIGILADSTGNDRYHAFQQAQGFGYTSGCGLLIDARGDDEYVADDAVIRFPSAQSKEHNSSLSQGFGFGKRADFTDGHSLAGGFGMLADGAGNDVYRCGVFGQGAGYWYGVGVLADADGEDSYDGIWYTQGSAAHFALGVLRDGGGNDTYRSTMNMAMGAGHDFSLGLLYDHSGRDSYRAPNLSLGGGNANGFGIFWDRTGDDTYEVESATALGRSNVAGRGGLRDRMKNLGLFLDTGGRDVYPESKPFARDGRLWIQHGTDTQSPLATEAGVGLDTEWEPARSGD